MPSQSLGIEQFVGPQSGTSEPVRGKVRAAAKGRLAARGKDAGQKGSRQQRLQEAIKKWK